jgi:hypothetical protein
MGQKVAKGRGNQGDWCNNRSTACAVTAEHREHNAAIESKRQAKLARRKARG